MKLFDEILHCPDEQGWTNPNISRTKNIVEIAEDFAIGFAEWCKQEYDVENTAYHNKWLDVDGTYVSTKELLEIYKKEKGL